MISFFVQGALPATFLISFIIAVVTVVSGQDIPGSLDPLFGETGRATTPFGSLNSDESARDIAIQPDGKYVTVGGISPSSGSTDSMIIRYNADGTLDNSFDQDGILILQVSTSNDGASAVAVLPDAKIVIAGQMYAGPATAADVYVFRLNPDGSIDTTFGTQGKTLVNFNNYNDEGNALSVLEDGKILVGGTAGLVNYADFGLFRLNADGSLDTSFGTGGKVTTTAFQFGEYIQDIKLQPDGKIVAAGWGFTGIGDDFFLVRYNPDGSLDTAFDGDGKVITATGERAYSVAIYPDGRIAAAGYGPHLGGGLPNDDFVVVRYNQDGSLDSSFGSGGVVRTAVGNNDDAYDAVLQPDGKLVVAGAIESGGFKFGLIRYNLDGTLDQSFGTSGVALTPVGTIEDKAFSLKLRPDGKFIAAGSSFSSSSSRDFAIVGYIANGGPDPSIGFPGRITTALRTSLDAANDVVIQPDGKIIAVGSSRSNNFDDFAICRYNPDGYLDRTFASSGRVVLSLNAQHDAALAVALQPDGKILIGGYSGSTNSDLAIVRYNANGSLDSTFGSNGRVIRSVSTGTDIVHDIKVQPNGSIVVAGVSTVNGSTDLTLARFTSNGSQDLSFDFDGIATTTLTDGADRARKLEILSNGKILVAADSTALTGNSDLALVRFNSDGSLDNSFGNGGKAIRSTSSENEEIFDMALQPDEKILVTGSTSGDTGQRVLVARFFPDGTIDASFGLAGVVVLPRRVDSVETGSGIAIQQDGRIIVAGVSILTGTDPNFLTVRLVQDGSIDGSFGDQGVVITDYGLSGEDAKAIALQADGKVVVSGSVLVGGIRRFALLRYNSGPQLISSALFDYDGDGKSDLSVRRPTDNVWYLLQGTAGYTAQQFGEAGDRIAPADYDGDGKTDVAVFRPLTGTWFVFMSESQTFEQFGWGANGDLPVPTDRDNDGKADLVVFRPSNNTWYTRYANGTFATTEFGVAGDKPLVGDFDADGIGDIALFRPSNNNWYILKSSLGFFIQTWGETGDIPVPADFDGDGATDQGVFRPSTGQWFLSRTTDGFGSQNWGQAGDIPVAADYDGDGKADVAVFRPTNGTWYIVNSSTGQLIQQFGQAGDVPTQSSFLY